LLDKLRGYLKSQKGFTLIELLVVIAIIAILVVIVVVAINPVQRLRDAADRRAAANTRAAGTLISACITTALSTTPPGTLGDCDSIAKVNATGQGNWPATASYADNNAAGDPTNICAIEEGSSGTFWRYQSVNGEVDSGATSLTNCP